MRYSKPYLLLRGDRNAEAFRDFSGLHESILSHEEDEQPPTGVKPSDRLGGCIREERGAAVGEKNSWWEGAGPF
jgi:hypothetical protein